jgi:TolB-like protein/tRNA A-37 threonylcarbamoyl transferase component Bud32/Tfp pilus assembly protein PilF
MPISVGDKLGPYEILALIGSGGMGEVYKARDPRLNRFVAIKLLKDDQNSRFQQEARAIAALNHPHICQIYDVGPDYLVMEYIEGQPLRGPMPIEEAVRLGRQIAEALAAAHTRGILHRDLKPANVLVTEGGTKLVDFGLAKATIDSVNEAATTQTVDGTILGTAAYMSPEQAQGKTIDERSEVFSFGAVLYEMLSGRRAFAGDSMIDILSSVVRDEPPPLTFAQGIWSIIERCLRKNPANRFQNMRELKTALEASAARPTERPSIAVLPFANLSAEKDNEYFSDGLAEEILNALTQLQGLRVVARASAFAFRGRESAIAEIGEKLRVESILHGSVRRAGDRIRISVQLINVGDESQLWSERYDRELRDIFDIQDEIAKAVVAALRVRLGANPQGPIVKRYTDNLEAHSLYLKGNFHFQRLTNDEREKGREYLERAVVLEPGHAPALCLLAEYYFSGAHRGEISPLDQWAKARAGYERALNADPDLAEAHAALAFIKAMNEYQWDDGLRGLDAALSMNASGARAHFWRSFVLCSMGRSEEALAQVQRAIELDPLLPLIRSYSSVYCLYTGQAEAALKHARTVLDIDPNYPIALFALGEAHSLLGRHAEGIALMEKSRRDLPEGYFCSGFIAWAYVRAGRRGDAEQYLARLEETRKHRYAPPGTLALISAALGDLESAFRYTEESIAECDPNVVSALHSPYFEVLRSDPRYPGLLRRVNLGAGSDRPTRTAIR